MTNLRITDESEIPEPNYDQPEDFGWREFYDFRNHVIRVLRRFGSAGPCGEADLSVNDDDAPAFEEAVVRHPDFFVVDDMYNEHDRISLVESDPKHINAEVIVVLAEMASAFPGWRVVLKLGDCGLDVFEVKVIAGGRRFWGCDTVEELASRCARPVNYGPPLPFRETMYPLWLAVVAGEFESSRAFPTPPDREWQEAIRALDNMIRREQAGSPLSSFAYDRIRCDLHPHTRLQFVQRFLQDIASHPHTRIEQARMNILKDAGEAMSASPNSGDRVALARSVSTAQNSVATWSKPNDIVFWWPYVISAIGEPEEALALILAAEIRALLNNPNSWIQLSAVFGLALLRIEDIAGVVDAAVKSNPNWSMNEPLRDWLRRLRRGATMYPSLTLS
jgi:hypothetical protein